MSLALFALVGWSGKIYVGYISLYGLVGKSVHNPNIEWLSEPGSRATKSGFASYRRFLRDCIPDCFRRELTFESYTQNGHR
jgi:hypothetical protein